MDRLPPSSVPTFIWISAFKFLSIIQKMSICRGLDLNVDASSRTVSRVLAAELLHASRPVGFCAVHAPSAAHDVSSMRRPLRWRAQGQELLLSRPISVHGIRAVDLSRESARYRSMPAGAILQALSLWAFAATIARNTLANANAARDWRLYANFAQRLIGVARSLVRRRALRCRSGPDCLRSRCHNHRSVSVGVPVGAISFDQSRRQTAHAARSARKYSQLYPHLRWQDPRCQRARFAATRSLSPFTSWIVATSTSSGSTDSTRRTVSSSHVPNQTSMPNVATPIRSIDPPV